VSAFSDIDELVISGTGRKVQGPSPYSLSRVLRWMFSNKKP